MGSLNEENINFVLLSNLLNGNAGDIINFAQRFIDSTVEDIDVIESAWERNDIEIMNFFAHRAKGRAGTVGAIKLARLFQQLEILLLVGDRGGAKKTVGALRVFVAQIKVDVARYLAVG